MKKYFFTKLSGAGNDFVLFDSKLNPELQFSNEQIQKICHRNFGIGADGVLLIYESTVADFNLKYFNADGSSGSLCANGSRCAIYYTFLNRWTNSNKVNFTFNNEFYNGEVIEENLVKFYLHSPSKSKFNFKIKALNQLIKASFADTGSPHVVINIKDVLKKSSDLSSFYNNIKDFPVYELGKEIRFHKDFQPYGVNVNFLQIDDDLIKIRTYERGVENETLSCGTGTVASALVVNQLYEIKPPIKFLSNSGDFLIVDFVKEVSKFNNISLTGPAKIIFKGEITF